MKRKWRKRRMMTPRRMRKRRWILGVPWIVPRRMCTVWELTQMGYGEFFLINPSPTIYWSEQQDGLWTSNTRLIDEARSP